MPSELVFVEFSLQGWWLSVASLRATLISNQVRSYVFWIFRLVFLLEMLMRMGLTLPHALDMSYMPGRVKMEHLYALNFSESYKKNVNIWVHFERDVCDA